MTAQPEQAQTTTGADVPDSKDSDRAHGRQRQRPEHHGRLSPFRSAWHRGRVGRLGADPSVGLAKASLGFWSELGKIAAGQSRHNVDPGDRRFSDPAWKENSIYSGLLQGYLALRQSMAKYATDSNLDERAQFLLDQVGDALAPSNFLLG